METIDRIFATHEFCCEGKNADGSIAFPNEKDRPFVIVRIYESGISRPLCGCLYGEEFVPDDRCNPKRTKPENGVILRNCIYYKNGKEKRRKNRKN